MLPLLPLKKILSLEMLFEERQSKITFLKIKESARRLNNKLFLHALSGCSKQTSSNKN